jgi:hypothetical protein
MAARATGTSRPRFSKTSGFEDREAVEVFWSAADLNSLPT